jgi:hypothetical protein
MGMGAVSVFGWAEERGMTLMFGNVPVPYTMSWSGETASFIARCEFADGRMAICDPVAHGQGKPMFGRPHSQRQREVIRRGLCDICARSLDKRTKVSLSHAAVRAGAEGPCVMQVEPLVHKECAILSLRHCPSLRRDIKAGTLRVRQISRYRTQVAIIGPQFVREYVPDYRPVATDIIAGHAKVELLSWKDRDEAWLQ